MKISIYFCLIYVCINVFGHGIVLTNHVVEQVSLYLNINMWQLCHHQLVIVARGYVRAPAVKLNPTGMGSGGEGILSVVRLFSTAAAWGEGSRVVLTLSVLLYEVRHVPASHGHMCLGFARHAIQRICHKFILAQGP